MIGWLVFGGLAGWSASKIMGSDAQQGILLNIIVGVIGAALGGFLWRVLTHDPDPYQFWHTRSWVTAIMGSSLLLWLVSFIHSPRRVS